jgi:hypothetical protein
VLRHGFHPSEAQQGVNSNRSSVHRQGRTPDFVYVHNQMAERPTPRQWINWAEEYYPVEDGKKLRKKSRRK